MELNEVIINYETKKENNISEKTNKKSNRIHLELLSFIQKEILNKKNVNFFFSFSTQKISDKSINSKYNNYNDEQKSSYAYYSDDEEEQENSSSVISAEEEII